MSFLYEKDNYLHIINSAFPKLAQQAAPVATIDPGILTKLVRRLDTELSPVSTDVSTMAKGDEATGEAAQAGADLKLNDLKINNLIKFLADNKIKFGESGLQERIVYTQSEFSTAPPADAAKFDKLGTYMIDPVGLANYVRYLQGKLGAQNNPLINAQLRLLVDQVNQQFPDASLSRNPGQKDESADKEKLDSINNLFSSKYALQDGPNDLTSGDLKSKESLNAWLKNHEGQVTTYDSKGMAHETPYSKIRDLKELQAAWGTILKALLDRATRLRELATSADLAKKYDRYKSLLLALGANAAGQPAGASNTGATQNVSYQSGEGAGGEGGLQFIERVVNLLPLNNRDINLEMMKDFFNQLQQLNQAPVTSQLITKARGEMETLRSYLNADYSVFPMNTSPQDFARRLTSPRNYLPAVSLLSDIVGDVRDLIAEFYRAHAKGINDNDQWRNAVMYQIGRNQTDNSFFFRNMQFLNFLKSEVNQVIKVK